MQTRYPSSIREEELKNKVAADFFGAFDCTRIIGNVDFCVTAKTGWARSRATESAADAQERVPPLYWAEAKNHPTDIHQMNATSADETYNTLLAALRTAHKALAAQIAPKVFEYGFLKK